MHVAPTAGFCSLGGECAWSTGLGSVQGRLDRRIRSWRKAWGGVSTTYPGSAKLGTGGKPGRQGRRKLLQPAKPVTMQRRKTQERAKARQGQPQSIYSASSFKLANLKVPSPPDAGCLISNPACLSITWKRPGDGMWRIKIPSVDDEATRRVRTRQ